jgi:hypothetical protein
MVGNLNAVARGGSIYIKNHADMKVDRAEAAEDINIYNEGKVEAGIVKAERDICLETTGSLIIVDGATGFTTGRDLTLITDTNGAVGDYKMVIDGIKVGGSITIDTKSAINLGLLESTSGGTINIKSSRGINPMEGRLTNIIGGNLVLNAGAGSLGATGTPIKIKLADGATLSVSSQGDIYIVNIGEGNLNVDLINVKGLVYLRSAAGVGAVNKEEENIIAGSIDIEAKYIGSSDNLLKISLGVDTPDLKSTNGGIYIEAPEKLLFINYMDSAGDIVIKAKDITINEMTAAGLITINSDGTVTIKKVQSTTKVPMPINIKSANGIYINKDAGSTVNIIGGNLTLDGGAGSIGTVDSPIKIDLAEGAAIRAISIGFIEEGELKTGDIFIKNIGANDLVIDYIKTPGKVTLITPDTGIKAVSNGEGENINAGDLDMDAQFIGDIVDGEAQYLKINILKPLRITSPGSIYVENMSGDLNIGKIEKESGDTYIKNDGNIIVDNIYASNGSVNLISKNGNIVIDGSIQATNGNIYLIADLGIISYNSLSAEGSSIYVSAKSLPISEGSMTSFLTAKNIYITITDGDIIIGQLESEDGDISLTATQGSIYFQDIWAKKVMST